MKCENCEWELSEINGVSQPYHANGFDNCKPNTDGSLTGMFATVPIDAKDPKCFCVVEGNVLSNPMVWVGSMEWLEFTYCPKCGEKL